MFQQYHFALKFDFKITLLALKKAMWGIKLLAVTLLLLVLARDTELWRRRRRRRAPPPCPARNCQVGSWSSWSACSHQCGTSGTQRRSRSKTVVEACGGTCHYPLTQNRACNRDACKNSGTPHSSGCSCRPGYRGTCCESGKLKKLINHSRLITKTNNSVQLTIALDSKMFRYYETNCATEFKCFKKTFIPFLRSIGNHHFISCFVDSISPRPVDLQSVQCCMKRIRVLLLVLLQFALT